MKFILLVYNDSTLLDTLPQSEFDTRMRGCLEHADELRVEGQLLESQMLDSVSKAKTVRTRNRRTTVVDGPFAETKELLAGFNLIEADDIDQAVEIAKSFPWIQTGCIEVRPVIDINAVRERVNA